MDILQVDNLYKNLAIKLINKVVILIIVFISLLYLYVKVFTLIINYNISYVNELETKNNEYELKAKTYNYNNEQQALTAQVDDYYNNSFYSTASSTLNNIDKILLNNNNIKLTNILINTNMYISGETSNKKTLETFIDDLLKSDMYEKVIISKLSQKDDKVTFLLELENKYE